MEIKNDMVEMKEMNNCLRWSERSEMKRANGEQIMTGSARMKGEMNSMMFGGASTSCGLGSGTFARPLSLVLNGRSSFRHPSPVHEDAFS